MAKTYASDVPLGLSRAVAMLRLSEEEEDVGDQRIRRDRALTTGRHACADHNIAWHTRHCLDFVPGGAGAMKDPSLANDFSHPICKITGVDGVSAIGGALPPTQ
jgi:hypothetical protein